MNQIKVIKITETRLLDNRGQPISGVSVSFTVGEHGPFTEQGTKDELLNGVIRQRLDKFAQAINAQTQGF